MKGFAFGCGLALAIVLAVMGHAMAGGQALTGYALPLFCSLVALVVLPAGYWYLVRTPPPWLFGLLFALLMLGVLVAVWLPLMEPGALREAFTMPVAIWSAVWLVATLPFMRTATKR